MREPCKIDFVNLSGKRKKMYNQEWLMFTRGFTFDSFNVLLCLPTRSLYYS